VSCPDDTATVQADCRALNSKIAALSAEIVEKKGEVVILSEIIIAVEGVIEIRLGELHEVEGNNTRTFSNLEDTVYHGIEYGDKNILNYDTLS